MKNFVKWLGIIAIVVVIGFSITACQTDDNDGGGNNGGGSAVIGAKLELSGQVYTMTINPTSYTVTFPEYKDNLTIGENNGGTATITSGKLSYTIETPNNFETWGDLQNDIFYDYDNVTASDSSAKVFRLNFRKYDANTSYYLRKRNIVINTGNTSGSETSESVSYVYVDKDVTITGKGKTETGSSGTFTSITNNFSLALKKGWNAVYTKSVSSAIYPAGNPSAMTSSTSTKTISLNNPALKWVLDIRSNNYGSN